MIAPFGCRGYVHYVFEFWCSFPQLTTTTMVGIEQCCWMGGLWAECVCVCVALCFRASLRNRQLSHKAGHHADEWIVLRAERDMFE